VVRAGLWRRRGGGQHHLAGQHTNNLINTSLHPFHPCLRASSRRLGQSSQP
jgi:hypothetical protein